MPIFSFKCEQCNDTHEVICKPDEKQVCDRCHEEMKKLPATWGWYSIQGDNSSSATPHKFRKNNVTK